MSFEDALAQLFNLGQTGEPDEMLALLKKRHGDSWIVSEMARYADDKALELIRSEMGRRRRAYERQARQSSGFVSPPRELELWVEDIGYVPLSEITEEYCLIRAQYYRNRGDVFYALADEWDQRCALLRHFEVATLADLPEGATLELVAA